MLMLKKVPLLFYLINGQTKDYLSMSVHHFIRFISLPSPKWPSESTQPVKTIYFQKKDIIYIYIYFST